MKLSVLELTQLILSSMDSDEVNSISDTAEARQVAQVIRTAYYNILSRADLPEHKGVFSLQSSLDADKPVLMSKPVNVRNIEWIKYNKFTADDDEVDRFEYVTILPFQQFTDMMHQYREDATEIDTMTHDSQTFFYYNDRAPNFCTVLDDNYIIFDGFDNEVDVTLVSNKTLCYGLQVPSFTLEDDFIPEIDEQQFPLLLNEAKALAFMELKQMTHELAVLESRRQWRTLQRTKDLVKPSTFDQLPYYGRK